MSACARRPGPSWTPAAEHGAERAVVPSTAPAAAAAVTGFDTRASSYDASVLQQFLFIPAQEAALQLARQHLPRPRGVLDIGCGTGRLLRQARQQYPHADLVGVDLAWQMLCAAARATPTGLGIRYVRGAAERLPFADHTFDLVLATMSLRHWADPAAGIGEIGRMLTPGGVLVVADMFESSSWRPARRVMLRWRRHSHAGLPPDLVAALAAQHLEAIDGDRVPWCKLPDIQVIVAQQADPPRSGRTGSPPGSHGHAQP
jgi:ubiquinone/menaquinone biosynthesis C-methylase UbiE